MDYSGNSKNPHERLGAYVLAATDIMNIIHTLKLGFRWGPVSVVEVPAQSTAAPPFGSLSIAICCGIVVRVTQQQ
jgi:hypothetical protein